MAASKKNLFSSLVFSSGRIFLLPHHRNAHTAQRTVVDTKRDFFTSLHSNNSTILRSHPWINPVVRSYTKHTQNANMASTSNPAEEQQLEQFPEGRTLTGVPDDLNTGFKYFGNRSCPYAHRAWLTLVEKQIKADYIHIPLGPKKPTWYSKVNRYGTVPCLYDEGKPVYESLVVAEYLEEKFAGQGTQLLPQDPWERAAVRLFIAKAELTPGYELLRTTDFSKFDGLKQQIRQKLEALNQILVETGFNGPFLLGDRFSLAEVAILPFLYRMSATLKHYRDFDLLPANDDAISRVVKLYEAGKHRASFQETAPSEEAIVNGYKAWGLKTIAELKAQQ